MRSQYSTVVGLIRPFETPGYDQAIVHLFAFVIFRRWNGRSYLLYVLLYHSSFPLLNAAPVDLECMCIFPKQGSSPEGRFACVAIFKDHKPLGYDPLLQTSSILCGKPETFVVAAFAGQRLDPVAPAMASFLRPSMF